MSNANAHQHIIGKKAIFLFQKIKPTKVYSDSYHCVLRPHIVVVIASDIWDQRFFRLSSSESETPVGCVIIVSHATQIHTHALVPAASSPRYVATYSAVLSLHTAPQGWKGGMRREGVATVYNSSTPAAQGGRRSEALCCSACMLSGIGVMQSFPSFRRPFPPSRLLAGLAMRIRVKGFGLIEARSSNLSLLN